MFQTAWLERLEPLLRNFQVLPFLPGERVWTAIIGALREGCLSRHLDAVLVRSGHLSFGRRACSSARYITIVTFNQP